MVQRSYVRTAVENTTALHPRGLPGYPLPTPSPYPAAPRPDENFLWVRYLTASLRTACDFTRAGEKIYIPSVGQAAGRQESMTNPKAHGSNISTRRDAGGVQGTATFVKRESDIRQKLEKERWIVHIT